LWKNACKPVWTAQGEIVGKQIDLLQGTLDMLILKAVSLGPLQIEQQHQKQTQQMEQKHTQQQQKLQTKQQPATQNQPKPPK
jgi:hypothetical protein